MDCLATTKFDYESYEETHGRMALRPLMMGQSATPHKLLNDLLSKIFRCEYALFSAMNIFVQPCVLQCSRATVKKNCLNISTIMSCEDVAVGSSLTSVNVFCP